MKKSLSRRQFFQESALASAGVWLAGTQLAAATRRPPGSRILSPNDKLNVGMIGTANRAGANLQEVSSQNIVALCDVDEEFLAAASQKYPKAQVYTDFRRLIDQRDIDAIVIATPDHTHAVATVAALKSGRHVYCEKPLTHTVSEARIVAETAHNLKRVTQMGNQIHASNNYRRVVELIQSGAIGPVSEVHVWLDGVWELMKRPAEIIPVPSHLNYDLWLGPAPYRPYHPEYLPFKWRRWWDFGGGTLSDFGCHHIDLSHWALNLRHPITVEAEGPPVDSDCASPWLIVRYEYPSRGDLPPVKLTWYQGGKRPPQFAQGLLPKWGGAGSLFVGTKGMLLADYGNHRLLPEKDFVGFTPPTPFIPDSIGHHNEWIAACKTEGPTTCNFDYAGALTESVLLGNVAYRTGKKLEWDAKKLRATNCPEADDYLQHEYRRGWKI